MKVLVAIQIGIDPEKWAENANGPWPEDDKRSFNTAVRQDIKSYIKNLLDGASLFDECGAELEVR